MWVSIESVKVKQLINVFFFLENRFDTYSIYADVIHSTFTQHSLKIHSTLIQHSLNIHSTFNPQARTSVLTDHHSQNTQSASQDVVLTLTKGEKVNVHLMSTSMGVITGEDFSIFSGFFLHPWAAVWCLMMISWVMFVLFQQEIVKTRSVYVFM